MRSILILMVVSIALQSVISENDPVPFTIKANSDVTVSGVSSGGFMSAQMLVAYSKDIKGAGLFASGPYFCTRGTVMTVADCMTTAVSIYTDQLIIAAKGFEELGLIDKLDNLKEANVYVYSGTKDMVVWQGVVKKNEDFFYRLGSHVHADYNIKAEHSFPTDFYGNKCDKLGSPYISNCDFEGSKHALEKTMGTTLNEKVDYKSENLLSFDQKAYNPGLSSSFGKTGYIYVPDGCKDASCPLHVAFHGCSQTIGDIGLDYVKHTGYLGLAEANNIIVLFPQVSKSYIYPLNPQGCWDWWGYSESVLHPVKYTFPTKSGIQMKAIYSMIKDLQTGSWGTAASSAQILVEKASDLEVVSLLSS